MTRILAVGAHPDDIELGCTCLLYSGTERRMVVLSSGEQGGPDVDRRRETSDSASLLGAELFMYSLPDTQIDSIQESQVKDFQPDIILTMSRADVHQDHQAIHHGTKIAVRDIACTVLCYISPSSAMDFRPNWFLPITKEELDIKLKALSCHHSQRSRSYLSEDSIVGTARYWAMVTRSRHEYVEPYELFRHWDNR